MNMIFAKNQIPINKEDNQPKKCHVQLRLIPNKE